MVESSRTLRAKEITDKLTEFPWVNFSLPVYRTITFPNDEETIPNDRIAMRYAFLTSPTIGLWEVDELQMFLNNLRGQFNPDWKWDTTPFAEKKGVFQCGMLVNREPVYEVAAVYEASRVNDIGEIRGIVPRTDGQFRTILQAQYTILVYPSLPIELEMKESADRDLGALTNYLATTFVNLHRPPPASQLRM